MRPPRSSATTTTFLDTPGPPETSDTPEASGTLETLGTPKTPKTPGPSETSGSLEISGGPETLGTPKTPSHHPTRPSRTTAPDPRARFGEASWDAWSTRVVLRLTDPRALGAARVAVERELDAIDRACSRFRPDAELARVNASAGRAVRVSPLLAEALALALRAARVTGGDVDPTVGSALVLAGYDRDWQLLAPPRGPLPPLLPTPPERAGSLAGHGTAAHPADPPSPADPPPVLRARAVCGWRNVMLDPRTRTIRVPAGFTLDLGATAKAWAADRAARVAALTGGCGALVSIGGDIATSGPAPARGWAIHVTDDHRSDHHAPGQTISIHGGGLATSSTAVRRWSHRGRAAHHIIDPATGAPVRGSWRTVSVAAASCADANIATTAALVRAGAAPTWLARLGVPARLVSHAGRVYAIGAWPTRAQPATRPSTTRPSTTRPVDARPTAARPPHPATDRPPQSAAAPSRRARQAVVPHARPGSPHPIASPVR